MKSTRNDFSKSIIIDVSQLDDLDQNTSNKTSDIRIICPNTPIISKISFDKKLKLNTLIKKKTISGSLDFDDPKFENRKESSGNEEILIPGSELTLARLSNLQGLVDSSKTILANYSNSVLKFDNKAFYIVNSKPNPYKGEYLKLSQSDYNFIYNNRPLDIFDEYSKVENDLTNEDNINSNNTNFNQEYCLFPILRTLRNSILEEEILENEVNISQETNNTSYTNHENDINFEDND